LWRYAGSQFDADVVEGFAGAWAVSGVSVLHAVSPDQGSQPSTSRLLQLVAGGRG
jgi:hypothetical protein